MTRFGPRLTCDGCIELVSLSNAYWGPGDPERDARRRQLEADGHRPNGEHDSKFTELDPSLTQPQIDVLVGWATWPPRLEHERHYLNLVPKNIGAALVRKGLGAGPYHDYPSGWKIELNQKGMDLARRLAREAGRPVAR